MTDNSEWTPENLWSGLSTLDTRTAPFITRDVRPVDFEFQTTEKLSFIAGYVAHLIARVEALESEITDLRARE